MLTEVHCEEVWIGLCNSHIIKTYGTESSNATISVSFKGLVLSTKIPDFFRNISEIFGCGGNSWNYNIISKQFNTRYNDTRLFRI